MIQTNRRAGIMIVVMLLLAMTLFISGIFRPFTTVTKLWMFENQISVFQGLITLWRGSELFLFLILFVFTVCFPLVKISSLLVLWLWRGLSPESALQTFRFVSHLGKWSMLDVFVVALLSALVHFQVLSRVEPKPGVIYFGLVVVLTMLASMSFDPRLIWDRKETDD